MQRVGLRVRRLARRVRHAKDPVGYARALGVRMGEECRLIATSSSTFGSEPYLISLGDHVTLSSGVRLVTHDGGVWVLRGRHPDIDVVAPIHIGSNVFVGANSVILPGVRIGDDVVVAAGAVVTRDVASGVVVGGVPARVLSTIESYEQRSLARAIHVKNLDPRLKAAEIRKHFGLG